MNFHKSAEEAKNTCEAAAVPAPDTDDPYGPVHIDIERMERALAGPRWTMPSGLSREEKRQYFIDCAAGKIPPDTPPGSQADTAGPAQMIPNPEPLQAARRKPK